MWDPGPHLTMTCMKIALRTPDLLGDISGSRSLVRQLPWNEAPSSVPLDGCRVENVPARGDLGLARAALWPLHRDMLGEDS